MTEETKGLPAPENSIGQWIDSEPLSLMGLHGRVVLIEFLDIRMLQLSQRLAFDQKWEAQYRDKGLAIIGVHTPELDCETR